MRRRAMYSARSQGFLLDLFPNANFAYSLELLSLAHTGRPVANVIRDSDSSDRDFLAGEITDGTLTSWVGSGNGRVELLYDQADTTYSFPMNLRAGSSGQGPLIVENGSLIILGGKPSLKNDLFSLENLINRTSPKQIALHTKDTVTMIVYRPDSTASNGGAFLDTAGGPISVRTGVIFRNNGAVIKSGSGISASVNVSTSSTIGQYKPFIFDTKLETGSIGDRVNIYDDVNKINTTQNSSTGTIVDGSVPNRNLSIMSAEGSGFIRNFGLFQEAVCWEGLNKPTIQEIREETITRYNF